MNENNTIIIIRNIGTIVVAPFIITSAVDVSLPSVASALRVYDAVVDLSMVTPVATVMTLFAIVKSVFPVPT